MTNSQTEWWAPVERSDEVSDLFGGDTRVAPAEHRPQRARGRAKEQRERKRRRRRSVWVLVVAILMVAGAGYVVVELMGGMFDGGEQRRRSVEDYSGVGHGSVDGRHQARRHRRRTWRPRSWTRASSRRAKAFNEAFAANPQASSIQPGTYTLLLEMKASRRGHRAARPVEPRLVQGHDPRGAHQGPDRRPRSTRRRPSRSRSSRRRSPTPPRSACRPRPTATPRAGSSRRRTTSSPTRRPPSVLTQMTAQTVAVLDAEGRPAGPVGDRAEQGVAGRARGAPARGPAEGRAGDREPAREGDAARHRLGGRVRARQAGHRPDDRRHAGREQPVQHVQAPGPAADADRVARARRRSRRSSRRPTATGCSG